MLSRFKNYIQHGSLPYAIYMLFFLASDKFSMVIDFIPEPVNIQLINKTLFQKENLQFLEGLVFVIVTGIRFYLCKVCTVLFT